MFEIGVFSRDRVDMSVVFQQTFSTLLLGLVFGIQKSKLHDKVLMSRLGNSLGENISKVAPSHDIHCIEYALFDEIAQEMKCDVDVFGSAVVFWVMCDGNCCLVVHENGGCGWLRKSKFMEE